MLPSPHEISRPPVIANAAATAHLNYCVCVPNLQSTGSIDDPRATVHR